MDDKEITVRGKYFNAMLGKYSRISRRYLVQKNSKYVNIGFIFLLKKKN